MVTITVSKPKSEAEVLKLIETMTKEKGYKFIGTDGTDPNVMIFEINKNFEEEATLYTKPSLLLD